MGERNTCEMKKERFANEGQMFSIKFIPSILLFASTKNINYTYLGDIVFFQKGEDVNTHYNKSQIFTRKEISLGHRAPTDRLYKTEQNTKQNI